MFTFFTKKIFLVDYLEGLFDIHNHILPGIDDGAKNIDESIGIIEGFHQLGITEFICTPHIIHNYHDNTKNTIKQAFEELKNGLSYHNIDYIKVAYAAEHMIDDNFENLLDRDEILPLNENHVLIEMSYLQPSINFDHSIEKIRNKGLFPVFAHPERYQYLNSDIKNYATYKSKEGLKFQLNLLSLGGYYGADVQKSALRLLEGNFYDFVGSDAHNLRHVESLKSIKLKEHYVPHFIRLVHNNRSLAKKVV